MGFLDRVVEAIWETLDEFQGGPDRPRRAKKTKKRKQPKWVAARARRLPKRFSKVPKREIKEIKVPRKTNVWQRLKREYKPMVIKRERAIIKQEAPPEPWGGEAPRARTDRRGKAEWEKRVSEDTGFNVKIEEPQERVERVLSEPVKK